MLRITYSRNYINIDLTINNNKYHKIDLWIRDLHNGTFSLLLTKLGGSFYDSNNYYICRFVEDMLINELNICIFNYSLTVRSTNR